MDKQYNCHTLEGALRIQRYFKGVLMLEEALEVAEHMHDCAICRRTLVILNYYADKPRKILN